MAARRALLAFGVLFVVLFAIVAIAEGIGDPSVPSGDVALVESVPDELGEVTQAEFDHALELAAKQAGEKKAPEPGSPKYDELKETALNTLFEAIWVQGLAEEEGIEVSEKEIAKQKKLLTQESFPSKSEFKKFLKESGFTKADVNEQVRLRAVGLKLQEELKGRAPKPSQKEVEDYYDSVKSLRYTTPATRTFRAVTNKSREKIDAALAALSKDNSAKNWKKVAKKYSADPNTKETGGLQANIEEGTIEEPINAAVYDATVGRLEGPIEGKFGYTILEVQSEEPEKVQSLEEAEGTIKPALEGQAEQEYFGTYLEAFTATWANRTHCVSGYVTERCANYKSSGHPATAPEGCYEADPKTPPEACPAPVFQAIPALPGSITPLERNGKPLPQRPRQAGEEAAAGAEGLPEGAIPPTGEAAPEEAPSE